MRYFDGYCPECLLQGREVPMQLNADDFWECPHTRLQVVVAAPVAGILRWRGSAQFRQPAVLATDQVSGLALAETGREEANEIQPSLDALLQDDLSLEWFIHEVFDTHDALAAHQFHAKDPVFDVQQQKLQAIKPEQWQLIFDSFNLFSNAGIRFNIRSAAGFRIFEQYLRQFAVIFPFNWQAWHQGWNNIRNIRFPYGRSSLLELSMYLSAIFLSEPYDEGTVEFYFNNKTLEKILAALEAKLQEGKPA